MQEQIENHFRNISKNIKFYREQEKLSQEKLAEKLECSREFINRLENNKEKPSLKMLIKISLILDIVPASFFE